MSKTPSTAATRLLREKGVASVAYTEHPYRYEEHGGTRVSAREEDDEKRPLLVLMHGDWEVSVKALARQTGARSVSIGKPETANRHSGYLVGGTSPFGTRKAMPVYLEKTILELPRIYVNGGSRGFLVALDPREVARVLAPALEEVGIAAG